MGWQEFIVLFCTVAASFYLIRRYASFLLPQKLRAKSDTCGTSCGGCSKSDPNTLDS